MTDIGQNTPSTAQELRLALAHHQAGRLAQAEPIYRKILAAEPTHPDALHFLGLIAHQTGHHGMAVKLIRQAIGVTPCSAMYCNLGNALHALGEVEQALECCREGIAFDPARSADLHNCMGMLLAGRCELEAASASFRQALALNPRNVEAHTNLGNVQKSLGQTDAAVASYRSALALDARHAPAHCYLGTALHQQGRVAEAIDCFRQTLALDPGFAAAHAGMGVALQGQDRFDAAVESFQAALALQADDVMTRCNLGATLHRQGKLEAALESYRKAIAIQPDSADVQYHMGLLLLHMGQLEEGWRLYRARLSPALTTRAFAPPVVPFAQWQGQPLDGKSIVVLQEQGLGDEIQFCRYAAVLKRRGARRVTVICKAPLAELFSTLAGVDAVHPSGCVNLEMHDYWTPLLDIPFHCGTTLDNIPAEIPYLSANPARMAQMAAQLAGVDGFKIGLCWQGSAAARTVGLAALRPLFSVPGVRCYCLQPDARAEFLAAAGACAGDIGHEIDAGGPPFQETAALIMQLDLVIGCDTSIGHLAGALGKPVWLLLPFVCDWRWMERGEGSPWYPKTVLFRQRRRGEWAEVVDRVAQGLVRLLGQDQAAIADAARAAAQQDRFAAAAASLMAALAHHQAGRLAQAEAIYREILSANPRHPDALHFLGLIAHQVGQHETAAQLIRQAIGIMPCAAMYNNLSNALRALGRMDQAFECCREGIARNPHPDLHNALGTLLAEQGDLVAACGSFRQALAQQPGNVQALTNLGNALKTLGQTEAAVDSYRLALAAQPGNVAAHCYLGGALERLGSLQEAAACCRRALALDPRFIPAYINLGLVLYRQGEFEAALASFQAALAIDPGCAEAQYGSGIALLHLGRYREAWGPYRARYSPALKSRGVIPPTLPFAQWQGQPLAGKSIILWPEQGLGDEIQFCRYAPLLKRAGAARVTLVCKPPLLELFATLDGVDAVHPSDRPSTLVSHDFPSHDFWTPLLDIPFHLGTGLDNVPAAIPYLSADPAMVAQMAALLAGCGDLKVGLCWRGGAGYPRDAERSVGLAPLLPLFSLPGLRFFSLQPGTRAEFLAAAGPAGGDLGHEIDATGAPFQETAALMTQLDLVISCDTSIGHLAGALGKPVWLLLPFVSDWRWMARREDSPWYPNTLLFRQSQPGDWAELVQRVAARLSQDKSIK